MAVRRVVLMLGVLLVASGAAVAQDRAPVEIFGGYSYSRAITYRSGTPDANLNGWHVTVSRWFNNLVAIDVEASRQYGTIGQTGVSAGTLMVGPRLSGPGIGIIGRAAPFVHLLGGLANLRSDQTLPGFTPDGRSETSFAFATGGGIDLRITRQVSLRPVQLDYINVSTPGNAVGVLRFSTGVTVGLGKR